MAKIYHMIIQRPGDWEGITRKKYLSTRQGSAPEGWKCIAVCGYHETGKETTDVLRSREEL